MSNDSPDTPAFQGGKTKFGDRTISSTYKDGNDVISQYNPTEAENNAYNYIQSILPNLYKGATTSQNFDEYTKNYTDNQKRLVNDDFTKGLNIFKSAMTTSGQMKDSAALDKLKPMETSYLNSMQNIEANAPTQAQQLKSNELAYNSGLLENAVNGINNFYNTGSGFNSASQGLSKYGNDWAQTQYQNELQKYALDQANKNAMISAGVQAAGMLATGGLSSLGSLGSLGRGTEKTS